MQKFMRFSLSGLAGIIITATLFLGMTQLLRKPTQATKVPDVNIDFSFVREFQAPEQTPPKRRPQPEPQKAELPPNAPALPKNQSTPRENLVSINHAGQSKPNLITGLSLPGLPGATGLGGPADGGLKSGMAPPYPAQPLVNKIEGWVEVLISVNELGHVSEVSVLQAKPRRVFNQTTLRTVQKWKFHPKIIDGKAVPYQVRQVIEFKLDNIK